MFSSIHNCASFIILCAVFLIPVQSSHAEETYTFSSSYMPSPLRWNNENWLLYAQPRINTFTIRDDGSMYGFTETGIPFSQYNVENTIGMRIQRFEIEDHYHYIIEGEVVYSLEDFSAKLALAYNKSTGV